MTLKQNYIPWSIWLGKDFSLEPLTDKINIPFHIAEDPLLSVAKGTGNTKEPAINNKEGKSSAGTGRSSQMLPCRSKETDDSVKDRYRKGGNKSSGRYKERAVRGREERGGEDN